MRKYSGGKSYIEEKLEEKKRKDEAERQKGGCLHHCPSTYMAFTLTLTCVSLRCCVSSPRNDQRLRSKQLLVSGI